jgi:pimeloyl-ACP methyl ester carboxylesterase
MPQTVLPRCSPGGVGGDARQAPAGGDRPDGGGAPPGTALAAAAAPGVPATDPRHRIGSMFVNPGGDGGSGVSFVRDFAATVWPANARARFDIVGFDPRGVGLSSPVRCFATQADEGRFFAGMPPFPLHWTAAVPLEGSQKRGRRLPALRDSAGGGLAGGGC